MVNFARVCGSVTAAALNKLAEEKSIDMPKVELSALLLEPFLVGLLSGHWLPQLSKSLLVFLPLLLQTNHLLKENAFSAFSSYCLGLSQHSSLS